MSLRALSLKYKFIITLVAFTVVVSVSFGLIVRHRLAQELWNQFYARGENLASTLAGQVNDLDRLDLLNDPVQVLEVARVTGEVLGILTRDLYQGEFVYAQLVVDGTVIFKMPDNADTAVLLVEPLGEPLAIEQLTLPGGTFVTDFRRQIRCGPSLETPTAGVALCGPSYVRLGLSPVQVTAELRQATLLIGLMSAGFVAVGVLVAFALYKLVLGPVEVLTHSVKSFRRDRFARARVHSGDELQTLAEEFNKMAATIAAYEGHLERINRELYSANRVKSEFLAVMGHELKTPLHAIRGFSQLLLQGVDGPLTPEQRADLEAILSSGDHLLELIDNILRFSKLEAGEETLHLETVRADALVQEALHSVQSLVRGRPLQLVDRTPPLPVKGDPTKVKQILINLLSNAVKHTPAGTITVEAIRENGRVRFSVADTGRGIDPRDAEKVFEPFTQLDSSTTRESAGIGLGLAIVKKYVEMHGGRVWFEGVPTGGTVFHFTLPAAAPETALTATKEDR